MKRQYVKIFKIELKQILENSVTLKAYMRKTKNEQRNNKDISRN